MLNSTEVSGVVAQQSTLITRANFVKGFWVAKILMSVGAKGAISHFMVGCDLVHPEFTSLNLAASF